MNIKQYQITPPSKFTLEDSCFFNQKLNIIQELKQLNPKIIAGIKDIDSIYQAATDAYSDRMGILKGSSIVGRSDFDIPCDGIRAFAKHFIEQDQEVMNTGNALRSVNCHIYNNKGLEYFICDKTPIIKDDKILGLFYTAHKQEYIPDELKIFRNLFDKSKLKIVTLDHVFTDKSGARYKFTSELDLEICFYLLLGYSNKSLINVFSERHNTDITTHQIRHSQRRICDQLNIVNPQVDEIVLKLKSLGFVQCIPQKIYEDTFKPVKCSVP